MKSSEPEMIKIFIAFADEDRDVRDKLWRQMNLVKHRQGWEIWSDKEIKAGEQWDTQIKQRLSESDVVVLLLSTDFFNSAYIIETELPEAIAKHTKGNCQIIPVIARKCHWKETVFGDYAQLGDIQALPAGEKPLVSKALWDHEDDPYFETVQGIKEAIIAFQAAKNKKTKAVTKPHPEKPETVASKSAPQKAAPATIKQHSQKAPGTPAQGTSKKQPATKTVQKPKPQGAKTTLLDDLVQFFEGSEKDPAIKRERDAEAKKKRDALLKQQQEIQKREARLLREQKQAKAAERLKLSLEKQKTTDHSLFPLFGVTLGKTTEAELKKLGVHTKLMNDSTNEPFKLYIIQEMNFEYKNGLAERIYLTNSKKMPEKWKALGFDWSLSYREWINLFGKLGYEASITESPNTGYYNNHPSFNAEVRANYIFDGIKYGIRLGFRYSKGVSEYDKNTLYNLAVWTGET